MPLGDESYDLGADGRPLVAAGTGFVLVLLPGGPFWMGAERDEESKRHDPDADDDESPVHEVRLAPFFIAKYETTTSQWAHWRDVEVVEDRPATLPAVNVRWKEIDERCKHGPWKDLCLPTEAQWEYAARGGTPTVYWTGNDPTSLRGAGWLGPGGAMAVDAGRENPFGLRQVHGNVFEWCLDWVGSYELKVKPATESSSGRPQ